MYLILLVRSFIVEIKEKAKSHRYRTTLRQSDIEAIYYIPERKYSVLTEPDSSRKETEDLPAPSKTEYIVEPGVSDDKAANEDMEDVELNTEEKQDTLSYPFKFVAIKIPKEGGTKDNKDEDDIKKEKVEVSDKDVKSEIKEKTDEEAVREIINPLKWSIFGRRKKKGGDDSKTTEETKKP